MQRENERLKHQNNSLMRQHLSNTQRIDELDAGKKKDQPKETSTACWKAVALPLVATFVPIIAAFCLGNR